MSEWRNKTPVVVGTITCTVSEVDEIEDRLEAEGYEYVGGTITPGLNLARISYGHFEDDEPMTFAKLVEPLERAYEKRCIELQNKHWRECESEGRSRAATVLANKAGLTGRDAEAFIEGFTGIPAKVANPRKDGREPIFRDGRAAWGSEAGQREFRYQSAHVLKNKPFERPPFPSLGGLVATSLGGLVANSEYH